MKWWYAVLLFICTGALFSEIQLGEQAKRNRDTLYAFLASSVPEAYRSQGMNDQAVIDALYLYISNRAGMPVMNTSYHTHHLLKSIAQTRNPDPLPILIFGLTASLTQDPGIARALFYAGGAMKKSTYNAYCRSLAFTATAKVASDTKYYKYIGISNWTTERYRSVARDCVKFCHDDLATLLRETPESEGARIIYDLVQLCGKLYSIDDPIYRGIHRMIDTVSNASLRDAYHACADIAYGWNIRGGGFIDTVTKERSDEYERCIRRAGNLLAKAWAADQSNQIVPYFMLEILRGSDFDATVGWARKGFELYPNIVRLFPVALNFTAPKWSGEPARFYEFARECMAASAEHPRLPLFIYTVHAEIALSATYAAGNKASSQEVYWNKWPAAWADISNAYERYLANYPDDHEAWYEYSAAARRAGQYSKAVALFDVIISNKVCDVYQYSGEPSIIRMRDDALLKAKNIPSPKPTTTEKTTSSLDL